MKRKTYNAVRWLMLAGGLVAVLGSGVVDSPNAGTTLLAVIGVCALFAFLAHVWRER